MGAENIYFRENQSVRGNRIGNTWIYLPEHAYLP